MIPKKGKPLLWEELSWTEVQELTKTMKMAILPCGAIEQHGPHLPLCVDTLDVYEVAKRISAATGVPVLQPFWYGVSQRHGDFPGTIAFRPETFMMAVLDIAHWLYKAGIRKLLLLNGHMWNIGSLQAVRDKILDEFPRDMRVRFMNWWEVSERVRNKASEDNPEDPTWIHANIAETSCVLAIRPDLVDMSKASNYDDVKVFWDYRMDQYTPTGIVGRKTTESTAEWGEALFQMVIEDLVPQIKEALEEQPRVKGDLFK